MSFNDRSWSEEIAIATEEIEHEDAKVGGGDLSMPRAIVVAALLVAKAIAYAASEISGAISNTRRDR